jgi:hypothetical protein
LCKSKDTQIKQKIIEDGIEKNIEYCKKCFKDVQKYHLKKISSSSSKNIKIINSYGDTFVSKESYISIIFDMFHERIITELPLHVLKATFILDEYSIKRNQKSSIDRNLKYLENSLNKAKDLDDEPQIKRLKKLIKFFKSIK